MLTSLFSYKIKPLKCERYYPLDCNETPYEKSPWRNPDKNVLEEKFIFFQDVSGKEEDFIQQAINGDIISQRQLGRIYCRDNNYDEGQKWLRKAADNNDAVAQYLLGCSYYSTQNLELAIRWYKKAADNDNTDAEYLLGRIYYFCDEYQEAIKWYKKLAKKNISWAERELGAIFFLGIPSKDHSSSLMGCSGYCSQENYIKINLQEAIKWFKKAASHGNRNALLNLGLIYFHRYHDYTQAREYWKKAADNGDLTSAYYLGKYSVHDENIDSEQYFLEAVKSGNTEVKCELGLFYDPLYRDSYNSSDYDTLSEKAKYWYKDASNNYDLKARILHGNLLYSEKHYAEALKVYQKAISYIKDIMDYDQSCIPSDHTIFYYFIDNNYIDSIYAESTDIYSPLFLEKFLIKTGKILYHEGLIDDALKTWKFMLSLHPDDPLEAYQLIGEHYFRETNLDKFLQQCLVKENCSLTPHSYYIISCELYDYMEELYSKQNFDGVDLLIKVLAKKSIKENLEKRLIDLVRETKSIGLCPF